MAIYDIIGRNAYDYPSVVATVDTLEELAERLREDPLRLADEYYLDSAQALELIEELLALRRLTGRDSPNSLGPLYTDMESMSFAGNPDE